MRSIAVLPSLLATLWLLPSPSYGVAEGVYVESIQCVGGHFGLALPTDARKIRSIGKVLREEVGDVEQWDGYTATRKVLHFSGFRLGIIEFSNDASKLMVTDAEITSPEWNWISPFKLRKPISEAQALLGDAAAADPGLKKTYGSESGSIDIQTTNGIVFGVSYACYSG